MHYTTIFPVTILFLKTILAQAHNVCPPKDFPIDCYCSESKKTVDCPTNIPSQLPWDMKLTFDTFVDQVPTSFYTVYERLEISGAPLKQHPLRIEENTVKSLKFKEIFIWSFDLVIYIHPNAFPSTYATTQVLSIRDHGTDLGPGIFDLFKKFIVLKKLSLNRTTVKEIPKQAFTESKSSLGEIEILNGDVETIGPRAFAGCPRLIDVDLQFNRLTPDGIQLGAFDGIAKEASVNLMNNQGLTHLPRDKFEFFLDYTGGTLYVGSFLQSPFDTSFYLHCDHRADWICAKKDEYFVKLVGYRCKEIEYTDVFEYCTMKEEGYTITQVKAAATGRVASILVLIPVMVVSLVLNN